MWAALTLGSAMAIGPAVAGAAAPVDRDLKPGYFCAATKKFYTVTTAGGTWQQMRDAAPRRAHLAEINSAAENACVRGAMNAAGAASAWLGGNDIAHEGVWRWNSGRQFWSGGPGGSPMPGVYVNWNDGEPNDDGAHENCLQIYGGSGTWNDLSCSYPLHAVYEWPR
jgi:hypothetical protein